MVIPRQFKIGLGAVVSIVGDNEQQWERLVTFARALGPECVEVWVEHWRGNRWLIERKLKRLKRLLDGLEIILHAPFLWTSLITPTEAIRRYTLEELKATIELAEALDSRGVTIHGGVFQAHYLRQEVNTKSIIVENLQELLPLAQRAGQFLAVENLPPAGGLPRSIVYPNQCADLIELSSLVPGLKATLDIGHALQNNEAPIASLPRLIPILANIHLHNCNTQGQAHQPLDSGVLELQALLRTLLEREYSGYLTLEVFDPNEDKRFIRTSYELLRQSLATLTESS
ncbi:MAG: sugar phosphate isomerase/epimerase family protein [Thermofilum sp.]